jgi:hypothetical protein
MGTVLRRLGQTLSVGSAILILAACGGTATPTSAGAVATRSTATAAEAEPTSSVLLSGVVVDSSNRPVAQANVECLGANVACMGPETDVSAQDGPDQGVKTSADGSYRIVVVAKGITPSGILLNANARGFQIEWRQISFDAGCTSDQARCAMTLDFTLTAQPE